MNTRANFGAIGLLVPEIWPMVTFQHRFLAWPLRGHPLKLDNRGGAWILYNTFCRQL